MNSKWILLVILIQLPIWLLTSCHHVPKIEEMGGVKVVNITRHKGVYSHPNWSPDGKQIAVQLDGDIWITNSDGSTWVKLTEEKAYRPQSPVIWDKPEEINYYKTHNRNIGANYFIHSVNTTSKKDIILLKELPSIYGLSWNPNDPAQLLVSVDEPNKGFITFLYDFKNNTKIELINGGYDPKWSPNGDIIALKRKDGIYIYDFNSQELKQIYQRERDGEIIDSITWSPNGKWIAYRGGPSKETNGIYVLPSNGSGPPEQILNAGVAELDWSPLGDKIVFATINTPSTSELYIMEVPDKYR